MSAAVVEKDRSETRNATRKGARRDTVINVRVPRLVRELIDSAATIVGKSRSDFMIESARKHAIDVLLDQRLFHLEADQFEAFQAALDAPPVPNKKLKELLGRKAPWEK